MLDMSFSQIKDDFSGFRDGVAADVAQAVSGAADKIRVHTVQAGSLILDLHMMPDVCGAEKSVVQAAADLEAQVNDPASLLRAGKYTAHTKRVYYDKEAHQQENAMEENKLNEVKSRQESYSSESSVVWHSSRSSSVSRDHHEHLIYLDRITSKPHLNGEEVVVLEAVSGKKYLVQVVGTQHFFVVKQRNLVMDRGERWDGLQHKNVRELISMSRSQASSRAADESVLDSSDEDDSDEDLPAKHDVSAEFVRGPAPRLQAEKGTDDRGSKSSEPNMTRGLIPLGTPIVGMDASIRQEIELNSRRLARIESLLGPQEPLLSQADAPIRAYMVSGQQGASLRPSPATPPEPVRPPAAASPAAAATDTPSASVGATAAATTTTTSASAAVSPAADAQKSARQRLIQRSRLMAWPQHGRGQMGPLETFGEEMPTSSSTVDGTTDEVDTVSARNRLTQRSRSLAQLLLNSLAQQDRKNLHSAPPLRLKPLPRVREGLV